MKIKKSILSLTLISMASSVSALEMAGSNWKGAAEAGAVITKGNTETKTLNGKLSFTHERNKWRHHINLEALKTSGEDVNGDENTTAERYLAAGKSDYKFGKHSYMFGMLQYDDDRFSGYEYQATGALGYGLRVIHEPHLFLDLEAGPGARQSKIKNGDTENEFIIRASGNLEWKITETTLFSQSLISDFGEKSTIVISVSALAAQIVGNLSMKTSLRLKRTSDVPPDIKKTDAELALTLVYNF